MYREDIQAHEGPNAEIDSCGWAIHCFLPMLLRIYVPISYSAHTTSNSRILDPKSSRGSGRKTLKS